MVNFKDSKVISYPIEMVQEVILDIEKYPLFVPWCHGAKIIKQDDKEIIADLTIKSHGFKKSYTSRVTHTEHADGVVIESKAIAGPFERLTSIWKLTKVDEDTKVDFFIDFRLKSKILSAIVEIVFHQTTKDMMKAFENRVQKLHSKY